MIGSLPEVWHRVVVCVHCLCRVPVLSRVGVAPLAHLRCVSVAIEDQTTKRSCDLWLSIVLWTVIQCMHINDDRDNMEQASRPG